MTQKQTGRYLRYKLAFDRLDEALFEGWLLEAISLEESIITDRLLSIIGSDVNAASSRQSLSNLIAQAKKAMTNEEKKKLKAEKDLADAPFMYAIVDGQKEKV